MMVWVVHGYLDTCTPTGGDTCTPTGGVTCTPTGGDVPSGLEEEYGIYGIFSSRDKAEEHKELMGDRYIYVDPFEVDNPTEVPR